MGATRDGCIKEAVLGTIESFLDTSLAYPQRTRRCRLVEERGEDLLFAVLEEVIYLLDTEGEAPVDIELNDVDGGVEVHFAMVDEARCPSWGQYQRRCPSTTFACHKGARAGGAR